MDNTKKAFTVSIYTENNVGLLNRISAIFQKRHINIESINSSDSEIEHVNRWTIVVNTSPELMKKIITQIEKQVEVIKAYFHTDDELIYQESCMFKISSEKLLNNSSVQQNINDHSARIVTVNNEFFIIEKSGKREEIDRLYNDLSPLGFMQFVRSGRISISKKKMKVFGKSLKK